MIAFHSWHFVAIFAFYEFDVMFGPRSVLADDKRGLVLCCDAGSFELALVVATN